MRRTLLFLLALLSLLLSSCSPSNGGAPTGSVIVGVTSDLRVGVDVVALHVVMSAGGAVTKDETLTTASTTEHLALPMELPFTDLPDGTAVQVSIDAFGPGSSSTPLLNRLAATSVVAGKSLLLLVDLSSHCVALPGSSVPTCTAPETCVAGACESEDVAASSLAPYSPSWSKDTSFDPCKPPNAGAPVVFVGEGQADYLPLMDGQVDQVEQGPQGGHHVWVAIRTKNLHQSGSITSITGHFPDLDIDVGPFNVIFTQETDEGGYCKIYGLRFQLDQQYPIQMLLGHPLDIKVTVTDTDNSVGVGTKNVVLSKNYLQ